VPLPGAAALLNGLRDRGVYLGVVSNKTGRYLRKEAAALGWERYMTRLVGARMRRPTNPTARRSI